MQKDGDVSPSQRSSLAEPSDISVAMEDNAAGGKYPVDWVDPDLDFWPEADLVMNNFLWQEQAEAPNDGAVAAWNASSGLGEGQNPGKTTSSGFQRMEVGDYIHFHQELVTVCNPAV